MRFVFNWEFEEIARREVLCGGHTFVGLVVEHLKNDDDDEYNDETFIILTDGLLHHYHTTTLTWTSGEAKVEKMMVVKKLTPAVMKKSQRHSDKLLSS